MGGEEVGNIMKESEVLQKLRRKNTTAGLKKQKGGGKEMRQELHQIVFRGKDRDASGLPSYSEKPRWRRKRPKEPPYSLQGEGRRAARRSKGVRSS